MRAETKRIKVHKHSFCFAHIYVFCSLASLQPYIDTCRLAVTIDCVTRAPPGIDVEVDVLDFRTRP